jgi:hypothetical protein
MLDAEKAQQESDRRRRMDEAATEIAEALRKGDDRRAEQLIATYLNQYGRTESVDAFEEKLEESRRRAVGQALAKRGLTVANLRAHLDEFQRQCVAVLRQQPLIVHDQRFSPRQAVESSCRVSTEAYRLMLVDETMGRLFCLDVEYRAREWQLGPVDALTARKLGCVR